MASAPCARSDAGHHRALAGNRAQPHNIRRNGPTRSSLRKEPLCVDGPEDSAGDSASRHLREGRALEELEMSIGPTTAEGRILGSPVDVEGPSGRTDVLRMGVIGFGYWGPNIVRNLSTLDRCELLSVCDKNVGALARARKAYPSLHLTTDIDDVLQSPE